MEDVNENTKDLVNVLTERLEMSSEVIEDLVEVFKIIDNNYDVSVVLFYFYRETRLIPRDYSITQSKVDLQWVGYQG